MMESQREKAGLSSSILIQILFSKKQQKPGYRCDFLDGNRMLKNNERKLLRGTLSHLYRHLIITNVHYTFLTGVSKGLVKVYMPRWYNLSSRVKDADKRLKTKNIYKCIEKRCK
jgi:hypothetical protein